ncbi:SMI1/KNR4 family protein [Priestia taiwanensis]|uniref:Antitoxin YobK n=1 Tax=Priestia taiwanensis TaxID=1347902 RepID=A0A917AMK1_9BACI|nr:SMI1/KNR4 family protein [Priestia taiwanensis]MBM7362425.1 hypothetical protein [Priestia taiwanensis]GGE62135.1 antitoxin YobK [Priestia taiwanensis]
MKNEIINIIKTYQKERDFMGGVQESTIQYAEQVLNVKFPESYRWFVGNYGSGGLIGIEIYGCEEIGVDSSVIYQTRRYREDYKFPLNYIILNDIDGKVTCLDVDEMDSGECPIVFLDRHTKYRYEYNHENFYEYFLDCLQNAVDNFYEEE